MGVSSGSASPRTASRQFARTVLAAAGVFASATCIPTEPDDPVHIKFKLSPDSVLVAVHQELQPSVQVIVDREILGMPGEVLSDPRLEFQSGNPSIASIDSAGRVRGLGRGRTTISVKLLSGALGVVDPDSTFPARVIIQHLELRQAAATLSSLGDTISFRPGFRDGTGSPFAAADSVALTAATSFSLVSPGRAVTLQAGTGRITAIANGTDTLRASLDTSGVRLVVTVRQFATDVTVGPAALDFRALGQTRTYTANAFDARGSQIGDAEISWRSSDVGVLTVDAGGTATASANGTAYLVASADDGADSVLVTVQQVARQVRVASGDGQTGTVGQALAAPFVAGVLDSLGSTVTLPGIAVTFTVLEGGGSFAGATSVGAATDVNGHAGATLTLGPTAGAANRVSAVVPNLLGDAAEFAATGGPGPAASIVAVSGDGQSTGAGATLAAAFVVVARDGFDNPVPGYDVTFTVTAGGGNLGGSPTAIVATDGSGEAGALLTLGPIAGDPNTVEATGSGLGGSPVVFSATALDPVAAVVVAPAADTIQVGGRTQLTATTLDAAGDTLTGRVVVWSSSNDTVATVESDGAVTGVAPGDVTVYAASESANGTATIAVLGQVDTVIVLPAAPLVYAEDTLRLSAELRDAAGHTIVGPTVNWWSTDEGLATVDGEGLVTTHHAGQVSIYAEADGVSGRAALTILPIPVAAVTVTPHALDFFFALETATLAAQAYDSVGGIIQSADFTWASRDEAIASVDGSGTVTALDAGSTYVVASSGGIADSALITVSGVTDFSCTSPVAIDHTGDITASETWGPAVHRAHGFNVDGNVVLTVLPGALVCVTPGANIGFVNGARLHAVGRPDSQIVFAADQFGSPWNGLNLSGSPGDTSRLSHVILQDVHGWGGAVQSGERHAVVLDSVIVRRTQWMGVTLGAPGSRVFGSVITHTGLSGDVTGVWMGDSTALEESQVLNVGGTGVEAERQHVLIRSVRIENTTQSGLSVNGPTLAPGSGGVRVVNAGMYPLNTNLPNLAVLAPTAAAQDSFLGNARDTLLVQGSAVGGATLTARADLPWRVEGNLHIQSGATLMMEPGSGFAQGQNWGRLYIEDDGRLDARGTATDTVLFTALPEAGLWEGIDFRGTAADTNHLSYALIEYARNPDGNRQFAAVAASDQQATVIEHTRVRQSPEAAIWVWGPYARLADVAVDTTLTGDIQRDAVWVASGGSVIDGLRITGSGGQGLDVTQGTLGTLRNVVVRGGAGYPVVISPPNLAVWNPDAADFDSITGNGRDTLAVAGGTVTGDTITAYGSYPWAVYGTISLDNALFRALPGASLSFQPGGSALNTYNGGRVEALGAATDSVRFSVMDPESNNSWTGIRLEGTPSTPSRLSHVVLEYGNSCQWDGNYNCAALSASPGHLVIVDSSRVRQSNSAIWINSYGAMLRDVVVDTTIGGNTAVVLSDSTGFDGLVIRGAGGTALDMGSGPLAQVAGLRTVGGAAWPVRTTVENLARLIQTVADYDSLRGSAGDTLAVSGGTLRQDTLPVSATYPWMIEQTVRIDTLALLWVEPGARLQFGGGGALVFDQTGRLDARGTPTSPIVFTGASPGSTWPGLVFQSAEGDPFTPASRDTSYITNALIEYMHGIADGGGIVSQQYHTLYLDSVRIRQSNSGAISLGGTGSGIARSVIDTCYAGGWTAQLRDSTSLESVIIRPGPSGGSGLTLSGSGANSGITVRDFQILNAGNVGFETGGADVWAENGRIANSAGIGLRMTGSPRRASNIRVVGSGSYGAWVSLAALGQLTTTAGDQDSLLGNTRDTLVIDGGPALQHDTVAARSTLPWNLQTYVEIGEGALMVAEPGARVAAQSDGAMRFVNGGRLVARGTAVLPVSFVNATPAGQWRGLQFESTADTSYLVNVRIQRATHIWNDGSRWAVEAHGSHPLVIDSTTIRQSFYGAVLLNSPGSGVYRSRIDTTGSSNPSAAVVLGHGTAFEATSVRRSLTRGVEVQGYSVRIVGGLIANSATDGLYVPYAPVAGTLPRVTGSGGYPLVASLPALAALVPDAGTYDSLAGNTRDTVLVTGGTLSAGGVIAGAAIPWRVQNYINVEGTGVLTAEPGAVVAFDPGRKLQAYNGGRVDVHGSVGDPVVFTVTDPTQTWDGFDLGGTPPDTSRLVNVLFEHARQWGYWPDPAVWAHDQHAVVVDSARIRQSASAVSLNASGSRFTNSVVDTTTADGYVAVVMGAGTTLRAVTVRGSAGEGISLNNGALTAIDELAVTGSASYPLRLAPYNLGVWSPATADYDALVGNARDTVVVEGGALSGDSVLVGTSVPWLVAGTIYAQSEALLRAEPGSRAAFAGGAYLEFRSGARLEARGSVAAPALFTAQDPASGWGGFEFWETPSQTSYLINARVEYARDWDGSFNNAAIVTHDQHALIVDSAVIRQSPESAVWFGAPGSRISRSAIDTTNTTESWRAAVRLGTDTRLEDVIVRRSGGRGVETAGTIAGMRGLRVVNAGDFPVVTDVANLGIWDPTDADYAQLVGNARDTLLVTGGSLYSDTITASASLPWLVSGGVAVQSGALMVAESGARVAVAGGQTLQIVGGGRLSARGSATDPVVFTARDPNDPWGGIWLNDAPGDTSYITNARIEHGSTNWVYTNASVVTINGQHPLVIDSTVIRQSPGRGVWLQSAGSRITRSRVDTTAGGWEGIVLQDSTGIADVAVTGAGDVGISMSGSLLEVRGLSVSGAGSYPVRLTPGNLMVWSPSSVSGDLLTGNARDTLLLEGGTVSSGTLLLGNVLPWRVDDYVYVEGSAVLTAEPGAAAAFASDAMLYVHNGGRVDVHGSDTAPVVFTAADAGATWYGFYLAGTPPDTSRLVNVRFEHARLWTWPEPAVYAAEQHAVVVDSTLIRQSGSGVYLGPAGSRFTNSVVDTTITGNPAVVLGTSTTLRAVTVRGSAGEGVNLTSGTLAGIDDLTVAGSASYPLRIGLDNLGVWSPTAADDDLLTGNARDTVLVGGNSVTNATVVMGSSVAWRLEEDLGIGAGAVLQTEPGTRIVSANGWSNVVAYDGGRLDVRGSAENPVVFTAVPEARPWEGIELYGAPPDTSYLVNATVEYGRTPDWVGRANAAIAAWEQHAVVIDAVTIRQSQESAVWLEVTGSRLSRSVVDTTLTGDNGRAAVHARAGTIEDVMIRGSNGPGLAMVWEDLTAVSGLTVVDAAQLPVWTTPNNLGIWNPDAANYANLTGNAQDTLGIVGGTLTGRTITAMGAYPWRIQGDLTVDAGGVLEADSAAFVTLDPGVNIYASNGGRVDAHGRAGAPAVFTGRGGTGWNGFWLSGTADTSYFVNARIEHAGQDWTGDNAAIFSRDAHPVVIDSTLIYQPRGRGIWFWAPGSRMTHSTITGAGWEWGGYSGGYLGVATTLDSVTVVNSSGRGIETDASNVTITNCEISGNGDHGIYISAGSGHVVNYCNLINNGGAGIWNDSGNLMDGTDNWWGDADGPNGASGDGVSGNVTFDPWALVAFVIPLIP